MSSGPCELQFMHTDINRSCAGLVSCGEARRPLSTPPRQPRPPKEGPHELCFTNTAHLGVLQPHLQPLHGQQSYFLVATGGCEQPQEVPGHVVDGLATVQLVTKHVQNILFYALCEFIVPRPEGGKGGQEGCQLRGPYFGLLRLRLSAHLPWHELPLLLRT